MSGVAYEPEGSCEACGVDAPLCDLHALDAGNRTEWYCAACWAELREADDAAWPAPLLSDAEVTSNG